MAHPLDSGTAGHPSNKPTTKSEKPSQKKQPGSGKRPSRTSRPGLKRSTSSKKRIGSRVLPPLITSHTPTDTEGKKNHLDIMPSNNGTVPRYEASPSASVHTTSSSSRESTGSTSSISGRSQDNCHFAASPELQMVDSLLAMLTQNGARRQNGQSSQR